MIRETIYGALFNTLNGLTPAFTTRSRSLRHWHDTPPEDQPSLMQNQTGESAQTMDGFPTKWLLKLDIYVYAKIQPGQSSSSVLNPLVDAVCNALNTPHVITGKTNLGLSNVEWARVDGNIETDEGSLGDQAVAIIPVVILAI